MHDGRANVSHQPLREAQRSGVGWKRVLARPLFGFAHHLEKQFNRLWVKVRAR